MKLKKSNYHVLHVFKTAGPKFRKAIISKFKRDLLNSNSESILNVLNGNISLSDYTEHKLKRHKR
jgi:hypothetical protein